jgi:hypothetical protein
MKGNDLQLFMKINRDKCKKARAQKNTGFE